jgi:ribonuclease R
LDDQYDYDEETQRLVGRTTGRQFALGDPVKVRIENVSVPGRKIDLALVEHSSTAPPVPEHARGPKRRAGEKRKPLRPAPSRKHERGGGKNGRAGGKNGRAGGKNGRSGGGKRGRR